MNIKILWFTDLHAPNHTTSMKNTVLKECVSLLNYIKKVIVEYEIDLCVFGGDFVDEPKTISSKNLSIYSELVSQIGSLTEFVILLGNHDTPDKNKMPIDTEGTLLNLKSSAIYPFTKFDNVTLLDDCHVITRKEDNLQLYFIPYMTNPLINIKELYDKYNHNECKKILFGHFETTDLEYTVYNKDIILSTVGMIPNSKDLLDRFNLSLIGHIHEPLERTRSNSKMLFTGACRNINFGNITREKGIYIINTDDMDIEFIENPYTYYYVKTTTLEELKKYLNENSKEILSKTKLMFYYRNTKDIENINKIRSYFQEVRLREQPKNIKELETEHEKKVEFYNRSYENIDMENILTFIKEYCNVDVEDNKYNNMFEIIKNYIPNKDS